MAMPFYFFAVDARTCASRTPWRHFLFFPLWRAVPAQVRAPPPRRPRAFARSLAPLRAGRRKQRPTRCAARRSQFGQGPQGRAVPPRVCVGGLWGRSRGSEARRARARVRVPPDGAAGRAAALLRTAPRQGARTRARGLQWVWLVFFLTSGRPRSCVGRPSSDQTGFLRSGRRRQPGWRRQQKRARARPSSRRRPRCGRRAKRWRASTRRWPRRCAGTRPRSTRAATNKVRFRVPPPPPSD